MQKLRLIKLSLAALVVALVQTVTAQTSYLNMTNMTYSLPTNGDTVVYGKATGSRFFWNRVSLFDFVASLTNAPAWKAQQTNNTAAVTAAINTLVSNGWTGTVTATGTGGNVVTNGSFNSFNLIAVGDSLTTTNPSTSISYPSIMAALFGYNVLTNTAIGGKATYYVAGPIVDAAWSYFPTHTGNRTTMVGMFGRNDWGSSVTSVFLGMQAATNIIAAAQPLIQKAAFSGCDLVLISCPYCYSNTNAEPGRAFVTSWLQSLTNYGIGFVNYDLVAPPSTWTNGSGALNTAVSADGVHTTPAVNTNLAIAVHAAIQNTVAKKVSRFANPDFDFYYPKQVATGFTVTNNVNNQPTFFNMWESGDTPFTIEESWAGDVGSHSIPCLGVNFVSPRDIGGSLDWGFRWLNNAQNVCPLFVDTTANAVTIGVTNFGGFINQFYIGYDTCFMPMNQVHVAGDDGNNVHFENLWAQQGKYSIITPGGMFSFSGSGTFTATNFSGKFTGDGSSLAGVVTTNRQFTSSLLTWSNAAMQVSVAHGLGRVPNYVKWVAVCQTNESIYTVGTEIPLDNVYLGGTSIYKTGYADTNNVYLSQYTGTIQVIQSSGFYTFTTAGGIIPNWKLKAYAQY